MLRIFVGEKDTYLRSGSNPDTDPNFKKGFGSQHVKIILNRADPDPNLSTTPQHPAAIQFQSSFRIRIR